MLLYSLILATILCIAVLAYDLREYKKAATRRPAFIGTFLSTFVTDVPVTGKYLSEGINGGNRARVTVSDVTVAMINNDTLTLTLPAGIVSAGFIPAQTYFPAYALSGTTYTLQATLIVVSHDTSTGITVLKATGNIAQHSIVVGEYVGI